MRKYENEKYEQELSDNNISTHITVDISLNITENENPNGLFAEMEKTFFKDGEINEINYSTVKPSYIYILYFTMNDTVRVLLEKEQKTKKSEIYTFPETKDGYELVMNKDDDIEFGSFIVIANKNKINFPKIKMESTNEEFLKLKTFKFSNFYNIIAKIKSN